MWDLPRPGLEPVSPALGGGLPTTAPPGKPWKAFFNPRPWRPFGWSLSVSAQSVTECLSIQDSSEALINLPVCKYLLCFINCFPSGSRTSPQVTGTLSQDLAFLDPGFPHQSGFFPSHFFLQSQKNLRLKWNCSWGWWQVT